jgi:hypothetical protein
MKLWVTGLAFFLFFFCAAQQRLSYAAIDWKASSLNAATPDSLGRLIKKNFFGEAEKARAIYSWITSHIAYNTAFFKPYAAKYRYEPDPLDTAAVWPSGEEMTARKVMRRRTAVCDGYAKLFKVLCDYAGVESTVIRGFGRGVNSRKFATNHTWNAVRIDSTWHLLDVTWASGHLNFVDDFVAQQNDFYYLTPPQRFIADHYPEELRWTLLMAPPAPAEFGRAPFRSKNFVKYGVIDYLPGNGIVEAAVGDTLNFQMLLASAERAKQTGSDPFVDSADFAAWPKSIFVKPVMEKAEKLFYSCIVPAGVEWVHLLYNNDVVLHYRLKQKETGAKNQ